MYISLAASFQNLFLKANNETVVKVLPQYSYADVGEEFTVNITVINVQNLYGVEITLQWNASVLRVLRIDLRLGINESYQDGVLYNPIFIAKNETLQTEGKYLLAATSYNPAPPYNGTGNIVKITFIVLAVGNCTLDLSSKLIDWPPPDREPRIPWPIKHTTVDGHFIIIPEFPNKIIVIVFIILLTVISFFFNKIMRPIRKETLTTNV
jgi:hypothetical protein